MFDELMIHGDQARLGRRGLSIPARLPWYRSLPLSSLERIDLAVDGVPVDPDRFRISLYGTSHSLAEAAQTPQVYWFVLDPADLIVADLGIAAGVHRVGLAMTLRIPYGDPDFRPIRFTQVSTCTKDLAVLQEDA